MDNSSLCGTSVSGGENSCDSVTSLGDHDSIDKLCTGLSGKLQITSGYSMNNTNDKQERPVKGNYIEDEDEEEDEDDFSEEDLLAQMGYVKSEPKRVIIKEPQGQYHDDEEEEEEEEDEEEDLSEESILAQMGYLKDEPPKHEPITTPTAALNLVSAFKGSHSREGKPAKECRVSWAPDVYDPPPTSDDHYTESKTERHKSEHKVKGVAGKNRQKCGGKGLVPSEIGGKGSKGGGSKGSVKESGKGKDKKKVDKKQAKKRGGGGGGGVSSKYNYGED